MALVGCSEEVPVAVPIERPNIVFILVDDLGWNDVGYHQSEIDTPSIDALASSGITLSRSYAFPICSPTRAALMTGRNPLRFGVDGPMENDAMLPSDLTLLPEYFSNAGYETWMVGKWHLGMATIDAAPHARGFDHFYGSLGGFMDFYTHVYFGALDLQRNGESVREEGHATDLLTAEAKRLLADPNKDKPFFLYLSYNAPHTPLQYPPNVDNSYADISDPDRRVFAQMTTHLDTAIGEVIDELTQQGLRENTIVIFMSDNGGNLEAGASNGELRAGKGSSLEGGVRVPTVVSWPAKLQSGRASEHPVFAQDWLPTLLDAAGASHEGADFEGRSAWRAIVDNESVDERPMVILGTAKSKAVYDWPWKLIRSDHDELYNVVEDPFESNNQVTQFPERVDDMAAAINELPRTESRAAKGPPPETFFRDESGAFIYDIRMPETREPWAEAAK